MAIIHCHVVRKDFAMCIILNCPALHQHCINSHPLANQLFKSSLQIKVLHQELQNCGCDVTEEDSGISEDSGLLWHWCDLVFYKVNLERFGGFVLECWLRRKLKKGGKIWKVDSPTNVRLYRPETDQTFIQKNERVKDSTTKGEVSSIGAFTPLPS